MNEEKSGIEELSPTISAVDESISSVSEQLQPLLSCSVGDVASKVSTLQRAKLDLISLYAVNSMFWVYLKCQGINPTNHGLSKELERVKTYLKRLKEFEDKKLAPKVNVSATKRVMRNALWSAARHSNTDATPTDMEDTSSTTVTAPVVKPKKEVKRLKGSKDGKKKKKKKEIKQT